MPQIKHENRRKRRVANISAGLCGVPSCTSPAEEPYRNCEYHRNCHRVASQKHRKKIALTDYYQKKRTTVPDLKPHIDRDYQEGSLTPSRAMTVAAFATASAQTAGCFVEVGVHRGITAKMLYAIAQAAGKDLYLYDTFTGLRDLDYLDEGCPTFTDGHLDLGGKPPDGLPPNANVVVGDIFDTMPQQLPNDLVAFAHIDCDLYKPTAFALTHLYYQLSVGGYIVVDDYKHPAWPGVEKAVRAFLSVNTTAVMQEWVFDAYPEQCQAVIWKKGWNRK